VATAPAEIRQPGLGVTKPAELVQLSGRHRRRYRWRDRFGVAGFEGVLMLVGLSALPLPSQGGPKKFL